MRGLTMLFNLAVSLFVAPTPGLLLLLYANGGASIPPVQGMVVFIVSALGYWVWLSDHRYRRARNRQTERARNASPETVPDAREIAEDTEPAQRRQPLPPAKAKRHAQEALTSHEDLTDPLAERRQQSPMQVLIDRVADLRLLKRLVTEHEVSLINAFHRTVERDEYGAIDYGLWAYEADRFLLASSFIARTLNRHEAIATVTAEVEFLVDRGGRGTAPLGDPVIARTRALTDRSAEMDRVGDELEVMAATPPADTGYAPAATGPTRQIAPTPDPVRPRRAAPVQTAQIQRTPAQKPGGDGTVPAHKRLSEGLRRRIMQRQTAGFSEKCAAVLQGAGWVTQLTSAPGSDTVDIFAERGGVIVGLRCMPGDEPIGEDRLADAITARDRFGFDAVGVVAPAGFSVAARATATLNGICLLDVADLQDLHLFVSQRDKVVPLFKGQAEG